MIEKNEKKERAKKQRVRVPFNTGTRPHKSKKNYDRKNNRKAIEREMEE